MDLAIILISTLISATSVTITEPADGETYDDDWLPFRVIVENDNEIPDSVHYTLNGSAVLQIPRLNTDWPTYMQNFQNNGFSESPAPMTNTILWAALITGEMHEFPTPVTYEGMVYYTSDSANMAETDTLYALDAATGSVIWTYDTGYTDDAVSVVDGKVYTSGDSLFCLDAYTGGLVWVNSIGDQAGGTPVVSNGKVYCGVFNLSTSSPFDDSSRVACLDALDGSVIWADTVFGLQASCMGIYDGILIMPTCDGPLYGINAETGSVLWTNYDSPKGYWDSSPNIVDGVIYIGDRGDPQAEACIRAIDIQTGETIWEQQTSCCISATPAYNGERIYFGDYQPNFYCLEAMTGSEIWSNPTASIHGSPGATEDLVYFGEVIYPADSARVIALDTDNGDVVWTLKTPCSPGGFQSSPSITDGVMYYACTDGYLYAFGTGLKYTYKEDYIYADVGSNELVVTSWHDGMAVAADTINFTVTQTGITLEPFGSMHLCAEPNSFCGSTSISFELAESGAVIRQVFDLTGRLVADLGDQLGVQGVNTVHWNEYGDNGQPFSSGLYFCRIESEGLEETTGLCVLR